MASCSSKSVLIFKLFLFCTIAVVTTAIVAVALTTPAMASGPSYTIDTSGGDCPMIGTWDAGSLTCTLNQDIHSYNTNAITIAGNGVTLDGAGHAISGTDTTSTSGIIAGNLTSVTIKHVSISHFEFGINVDHCTSGSISENNLTSNAIGISMTSDSNVTADFNTSNANTATGLTIYNGNNNKIRGNSIDNNTWTGINLSDSSSIIFNMNHVSGNATGILLDTSNAVDMSDNVIASQSSRGLWLVNSSNNYISDNDFIGNNVQAYWSSGTGNDFGSYLGNYWSDHNTPIQGCHDINGDGKCDNPFSFTPSGSLAVTDNFPVTLPHGWRLGSVYWSWYDDLNDYSWLLLANANPAGSVPNDNDSLKIGGAAVPLSALPGLQPGELPAQKVIAQRYSRIDGPVMAQSNGGWSIFSERTLWPRGGSSLEEVTGSDVTQLSNIFYWTWYDQQTPGMLDWVIISNPNNFGVYYELTVDGIPRRSGTIAAGAKDTPMFPGLIGGPVKVQVWTDSSRSEPARVISSQRVLSNFGSAFNEVPGTPAGNLNSHYYWTWYDQSSAGAMNWVLVANPGASEMYYEIDIAGMDVQDDTVTGPIGPGQHITPTFPGRIGGSVEAKTWLDAGHMNPAPAIASQRSLWGPSFEEVPGRPFVSPDECVEAWPWYDEYTPGMTDWVLIGNTYSSQIYYEVKLGGVMVDSGNIPANGTIEHTYPGHIGGPLTVMTWQDPSRTVPAHAITSQRVLYNGYFNEVLGTWLPPIG